MEADHFSGRELKLEKLFAYDGACHPVAIIICKTDNKVSELMQWGGGMAIFPGKSRLPNIANIHLKVAYNSPFSRIRANCYSITLIISSKMVPSSRLLPNSLLIICK